MGVCWMAGVSEMRRRWSGSGTGEGLTTPLTEFRFGVPRD